MNSRLNYICIWTVSSEYLAVLVMIALLSLQSSCQEKTAKVSSMKTIHDVLSMPSEDDFPQDGILSSSGGTGSVQICFRGHASPIVVSSADYPGISKVAAIFQKDIFRVTGVSPELVADSIPEKGSIIIVGTLGMHSLIDRLIAEGKIDLSELEGKWEQFIIQTIEQPFAGIERALVIAGSDIRGTIYGMFELSEKMGVSPWYWWADVPVKMHKDIWVKQGRYTLNEPKVKYRGIFINDEAPAMAGWANEKFGGFNHQFYERVYELILRLKGNYLWPAMWGRSLFDDDPLSAPLADEYGIVLGTTHHEPMMRAHVEWARYGEGPWDYEKNKSVLRQFWREGLERMGNYESIVSLGMRGDGDEAMSEESNITLLKQIINDQREIIEEVTGKPAVATPQLWALYKEVQEYYNKGMRVPEDVTLLLCDDNWGNLRVIPKPGSEFPSGGYGIYYHFDFVGGPRNYKWLNTSPVSRVWEQMHLAYRHGVDQIWLVNVGDLKPMELPISFFLDFAWDPDQIPAEDIPNYHTDWAKQQFGLKYAEEIGAILMQYTKFNGRRKPEMLAPDTYSLVNFNEAENVVREYNALAEVAKKIYNQIPDVQRDAYYQLVLFPVLACANLNELHISTGLNHLYASQGRISANTMAKHVEELFSKDTMLSNYYHDSISGGKWNHMMSQTHISYTYWQQPEKDVLPELHLINPGDDAEMGVSVEGSEYWWPKESSTPVLPVFDKYNQQNRYLEIFNRGKKPFEFKIDFSAPWILPDKVSGRIKEQERIHVKIDWDKVPEGIHSESITINGNDQEPVRVSLEVRNPATPKREEIIGYVDGEGFVSIEAVNYSEKIETDLTKWRIIPDLGRTGSSVTTFPVNASRLKPGKDTPRLDYTIHFFNAGKVRVLVYIAPTLNIYGTEGLKFALSIDNEPPKIINVHEGDSIPDWKYPAWWNNAVSQNIRMLSSEHFISKPGEHTLKYWMVDPAIVLQKIVVVSEDLKESYLGPPESFNGGRNK